MSQHVNNSADIFRQLQEVYEKLDHVEERHNKQTAELKKSLQNVKKELSVTKEELKKTQSKLARTENELKEANKNLALAKQELVSANETISTLKAEIVVLKDDNERLKRIINNDSNNSSLPPSSNGSGTKSANTYNGRKATEKKQGAQKGHAGKHLSKKDVEKKIQEKQIECRTKEIGKRSEHFVTRYRLDLELKTVATKYIIYQDENGKYNIPEELTANVSYGPTVRAMATYLYSEGVVANDRIAEFINSASGNILHVSTGAVYGFCRSFSGLCSSVKSQITENLLNDKIINTDATNTTKNGKQTYIRNFSDARNALYVYSPKKTLEALGNMPIFNQFAGIFAHDHETTIYHFGTGHAECNVHIARYLRKNTEETGNTWSKKLSSFLNGILKARKQKIANGENCFSKEELERYEKRYSEILDLAVEQHKKTKGTIAYKEEKKLMNRLKTYRKNHLLFMYDFEVPFDNNMSERDLRKCKNRQKMAGGFRTEDGIEMYCNIMSVVETLKRRNLNILDSMTTMFSGGSVLV